MSWRTSSSRPSSLIRAPGWDLSRTFEEDLGGVFGDLALGLGTELDETDRAQRLESDAGREQMETAAGGRDENGGDRDHCRSLHVLLLCLGSL